MTARWIDDPVLRVDHLTMRFGGLLAVNDVSFVAGRGDVTALIGPNGAGKTTLFNCLTGFYKPTSGRIAFSHGRIEDENIEGSPARRASTTARLFCSNAWPTTRSCESPARPHVSKHPAVPGHERAGKPLDRAKFRTVPRFRLFGSGPSRRALLAARGTGRGGPRRGLAGAHRADTARRRPRRKPALWRPAPAGDRPRHVRTARPALPRRAGGGPQRHGIAGARRAFAHDTR